MLETANALYRRGDLDGAGTLCRDLLASQPRNAGALLLLGLIAALKKNLPLSLQLLDRVIEIEPRNAIAHCNRGATLYELKQLDAALGCFDRAIELKPDYAVAFNNRGNVLLELGYFAAAVANFEEAVALKPDLAEAWCNLGGAQRELKHWTAALASLTQALTIDPTLADAWCSRGSVLCALNRLEDALQSFDRALTLRPNDAGTLLNRGNTLGKLRQQEAALKSYARAIESQPDLADAHFNRALSLLAYGDLAGGWDGYQWRFKLRGGLRGSGVRAPSLSERLASQAMWQGEPLDGKSILIWCEQGLGDTLQFARYGTLLSELGARVILEVQPPLLELFQSVPGIDHLQTQGSRPAPFDHHCPLLSLPRAFKTTLDTLPAPTLVRADPLRVSEMQRRLGPRTRARVGLVWRGNPHHAEEANRRILPSEWLEWLPDGIQYVSLQREVLPTDRHLVTGRDIVVLADELNFIDTAAACECLDLIISIDTSIAHLSASLGKRTWILLTFNPDWRWMLDRNDSPWYPSVSLYRQDSTCDWRLVLERVAADLTALMALPNAGSLRQAG